MLINRLVQMTGIANRYWVAVCVGVLLSVTLTTNGYDPEVVGVPETIPVDVSMDSPGGSAPRVCECEGRSSIGNGNSLG